MGNTSTVILLTACIDPGTTIIVQRRNPLIRLNDYQTALKKWLSLPRVHPIVFCDNSGYDLAEIKSTFQDYNINDHPIELLSFHGQDFPNHLGKGYGEMRIISHTLEHSKLIASAKLVMKVSGRFFIPNAHDILSKIEERRDIAVFCDLRKNLTSSDSRVFCATISFLKEYLVPFQEILNDSIGLTFECILARAVHQAMADGRKWEMLPLAHRMVGIAATNNEKVPSSRINLIKREIFRYVKSFILNR